MNNYASLVGMLVFLASFYFWRGMYQMLEEDLSRTTRLVFSFGMALMWVPLKFILWLDYIMYDVDWIAQLDPYGELSYDEP